MTQADGDSVTTLKEQIDLYLRARLSLICIVSTEEERVVRHLEALCESTHRSLVVWDHAESFRQLVGKGDIDPSAKDPLSALEAIDRMSGPIVFVLPDFHQCWDGQPRTVRKLRNVAQRLKYSQKTIVITTPKRQLPEELRDEAVELEYPLPRVHELHEIVTDLLEAPGTQYSLDKDEYNRILRAARGLTYNQAQRAFAKAIVSEGVLDERDIEDIVREKEQIVRASGALEFRTPAESIADVGGLGELKRWLHMRGRAFTAAAQKYGLPTPKGIALLGIPGSGKSLTAKVVASLWRMPLLRLDVGALFGSLVGESEANTRRALRVAEAVAPCVLWIDELEKALSTGQGDSGTSMRVFASILSWMQEKTKPVFIVATANDISRVPPELLRRGRFDEIFFVDLPSTRERTEIFAVHLAKRGRDPKAYDVAALARASEGYVGAEIEQAVCDAMYMAFNDANTPAREFTTDDVAEALRKLIPLSHAQRERVTILRRWIEEGRAKSASAAEDQGADAGAEPLPLRPNRSNH